MQASTTDVRWETLSFSDLGLDTLYALLRLRAEVFVLEQQSAYLDLDNKDQVASHMLGHLGGELVAYQRCLPPGVSYPQSSLGRIVVREAARGLQLGRTLVQHGIDYNLAQWPGVAICISAQAHLQPFYASLGFVAEGDEYSEDGIPHRKMRYRV